MMRRVVEALPKGSSVHAQWVTCGTPTCHCATGTRHGPYYYLFWREGSRLRKRYLPAPMVPIVQVLCQMRRNQQADVRRAVREARSTWRTLTEQLRATEGAIHDDATTPAI